MLCLCFNFCNMCEYFYFSRVKNIYFIDIKMYKLILIFPIIIFLCLFSNKRKKFISPIKLKNSNIYWKIYNKLNTQEEIIKHFGK